MGAPLSPSPGAVCRGACRTAAALQASLEHEDVAPILEQLKMNLLRKNVAAEIADRRGGRAAAGVTFCVIMPASAAAPPFSLEESSRAASRLTACRPPVTQARGVSGERPGGPPAGVLHEPQLDGPGVDGGGAEADPHAQAQHGHPP